MEAGELRDRRLDGCEGQMEGMHIQVAGRFVFLFSDIIEKLR